MKSIKELFVLLAIISFCYGVTTKAKSQKETTMMEFFKDLLERKPTDKQKKETAPPGKNKTKTKTTSAPTVSKKKELKGWMEISSRFFKNEKKFPPIVLPDSSEIKMKLDKNFFRINEVYSPKVRDPSQPPSDKDFWFYLKKNVLYYTTKKTDMTILGTIKVKRIVDPNFTGFENNKKYCFTVKDEKNNLFNICSKKDIDRHFWVCHLYYVIKQRPAPECPSLNALRNYTDNTTIPQTITVEETILQPYILIPTASKKCNDDWKYDSNGADWECICAEGQEQSPINLPEDTKAIQSPVSPLFQYDEVEAKSTFSTIDGHIKQQEYIKIKYFANAIRIFHPNFGKIVTLDGALYYAEEIVFHSPAEHLINGVRYDMEMEIIHYGQSIGDIAKQAVLSFLFKKKPGVYNRFLEDLDMFSLPNAFLPERDIINNLFIPKLFYTTDDEEPITMKPFSFYTYQGSLSFPPCTERTIRYVSSEILPLSSTVIDLIKEATRKPEIKVIEKNIRGFGEREQELIRTYDSGINNYRQAQPLNGRSVFFFDKNKYCDIKPPIKAKEMPKIGHYEKVPVKSVEYLFVNNEAPSGLPGAFVISEKEAQSTVETDGMIE